MVKRQLRRKEEKCSFFDGKRYSNQDPLVDKRTILDLLTWLFTRRPPSWKPVSPPLPHKTFRQRVDQGELSITFVNHSTLLVQVDGLNILTDPIWSERCSPFPWLGPKRVIPPGIAFSDLPPIDIVLVTHNHYDHMDVPTLQLLEQKHRPLFFVPKGNARYLRKKGLRQVEEMDWWEDAQPLPGLTLSFVPAQHFTRRSLFDRNKTLWGGFVIQGRSKPIYFAGDTAYGPHFQQIRQEFGPFRVACLPIGAYLPRWFMSSVHMGPEEAVQAHRDLEAEVSIPIHFGTFQLSDEDLLQPVEELRHLLSQQSLPEQSFLVLHPGEEKLFRG